MIIISTHISQNRNLDNMFTFKLLYWSYKLWFWPLEANISNVRWKGYVKYLWIHFLCQRINKNDERNWRLSIHVTKHHIKELSDCLKYPADSEQNILISKTGELLLGNKNFIPNFHSNSIHTIKKVVVWRAIFVMIVALQTMVYRVSGRNSTSNKILYFLN
jgi:hypothetical protein